MRIAAIDQGTTSTRVLHLKADGRLHPILSLPHHQTYPAPSHVEQDAEELLANIRRCLDMAGADIVGLANQGESCLAWDAHDGRPICPVISWQDDRTADVTEALARDGAGPLVMARAGLPLAPYFSASKLGWILRHIPRAADIARLGHLRLGTTDAFFRDRLTGRFETDIATASRTSLMNLATGGTLTCATCSARPWTACRRSARPRAISAISPTGRGFMLRSSSSRRRCSGMAAASRGAAR